MNCLVPRPAQVIAKFREDYAENPKKATDHYYNFSVATNYIRKDRIAKDRRWKVPSEYGEIDITINLSKPEKDPKAIAAARNASVSAYPKCQLCMENEGYAGASITRPERITASFRSRSMTASGDSSILLMSTTMSTVSCSTENILR